MKIFPLNRIALSFLVSGAIVGGSIGFVLEKRFLGAIVGIVISYIVYALRRKDDV